ncbi:Alpha/Beta hydrolase protein [Catenaria anguillulae PL171]|uniref:Alpha/Beta hydrolase protein n=1 Tax=Catenaria anguillulae PL171 TaxID=765915 RepID=A0A1Y2HVM7_9FUNG|nr:Alpha/Beta hydrolase protein [Catenaria anguillulae PL171]
MSDAQVKAGIDEAKTELAGGLSTMAAKTPRDVPQLGTSELDQLKKFAHYAGVVYCGDRQSLMSWTCGARCRDPITAGTKTHGVYDVAGNFGFIAERPSSKEIYVVFRGSSDIRNWLDNFQLWQREWPFPIAVKPERKVQVHKGFIDAYDRLRGDVTKTLRGLLADPAKKDWTVVITGHSLGAAMATIAAVDLVSAGIGLDPAKVTLSAFHSPRVGNSEFSRIVSNLGLAQVERVAQDNDIIVHVPSDWLGYEHIAGEKYIMGDQVYACQGTEDRRCSRSRAPVLNLIVHMRFMKRELFFGGLGGFKVPLLCD